MNGPNPPSRDEIFLSHSSADKELGAKLINELVRFEIERSQFFFSPSPRLGIPAGINWREHLYLRLRRCGAVVILISETSLESQWCFAELAMARALGRPVLGIRISSDVNVHPLTESEQSVVLGERNAYERIAHWLRSHVASGRAAWPSGRCPFPGTRSYTTELEPVFFGRDDEIRNILELFAPIGPLHHLRRVVAISGPSGSGKSSLMLAGVIPRLKRRADWIVLDSFCPGEIPNALLVRALGGDDREGLHEEDVAELVRRTVSSEPPNDPRWLLIVIDQFEELVTATGARGCEQFLTLLRHLIEQFQNVWVILTVRSDYTEGATGSNDLSRFLSDAASYLLLPPGLSFAFIQRMVESASQRANAEVDPDLLQRLVDDVRSGDRGGASLPLVCGALEDAWREMESRARGTDERLELQLRDYQESGGIHGFISRRAEAAMRRATRHDRKDSSVLDVLLLFVGISQPGNRPIGRRTRETDLDPGQKEIIEEFCEHRLLHKFEENGVLVYEVNHDTIFEAWAELNEEIERRRAEIIDWQIVAERLQLHEADESDAHLVRGELLRRVAEYRAPSRKLKEFVDLCIARDSEYQHAQLVAQAEDLAQEAMDAVDRSPKEAMKRVIEAGDRCLTAGSEAPRLVADALREVVVAARQLNSAQYRCVAHRIAVSPESSFLATAGADGRIQLIQLNDLSTLQSVDAHFGGVRSLRFHETGELVTSGSNGRVARWSIGDEMRRIVEISVWPDVIVDLSVNGNPPKVVGVGESGQLYVWSFEDLTLLGRIQAHRSFASACAVDSIGKNVVTGGADGDIAVWRLEDCSLLKRVAAHRRSVSAVAIRPDGELIASAGYDGKLRLWSQELAEKVDAIRAHRQLVTAISFTSSGRGIVTSGFDGSLEIWDERGSRIEPTLRGHDGAVLDLAVTGGSVLSSGIDRTVRVWQQLGRLSFDPLSFPESVKFLLYVSSELLMATCDHRIYLFDLRGEFVGAWEAHEFDIHGLAVAVESELIASASADRTVRIWDFEGHSVTPPLTGHSTDVNCVAFNSTGHLLASADIDGEVRLWDRSGEPVAVCRRHESGVKAVCFLQSGGHEHLVTSGMDGWIRRWSLDGEVEEERKAHNSGIAYHTVSGEVILTVGLDGELSTWSSDLGEPLSSVKVGRVSMAVPDHPSGFVTAGYDGRIQRWTRELTLRSIPLKAHDEAVWALAVCPEGKTIATGGSEGSLRVWRGGDWRSWFHAARDRANGKTSEDLRD